MQNFRALGGSAPRPPCLRRLGVCPQTPSLRRLGASLPDPLWPPAAGGSAPRPPKQPPPLRISGYAPVYMSRKCSKINNIFPNGLCATPFQKKSFVCNISRQIHCKLKQKSLQNKSEISDLFPTYFVSVFIYNYNYNLFCKSEISDLFCKRFLFQLRLYFVVYISGTKDHKYHKLFNRYTIKISYSCMNNMADRIKGHNNKILKQQQQHSSTEQQQQTCNCRKKSECPLNGNCLQSGLVYQATIETDDTTQKYIGLTEGDFKTRYRNHTKSFNHKK